MVLVDWLIMVGGLLGSIFWARGFWKGSVSDCVMGLLVVTVSASAYFVLFSLTRVSYLGSLVFLPSIVTSLLLFRRTPRLVGQILLAIVILMGAGAASIEYRIVTGGNALLVIEPYRTGGGWAFDDQRLGLIKEPFVNGVPEIIDRLVAGIPGSKKGIRLIFSGAPFPGAQLKLDRRSEEKGGNWYYSEAYGISGWLCPAMFRFFPRAPRHIYVKAEAR
jgi:hypothetical protein